MIEVELIKRGIQNSPAQIISNHSDAQEKLREYHQYIPDSEYEFITESLYEMEVIATLSLNRNVELNRHLLLAMERQINPPIHFTGICERLHVDDSTAPTDWKALAWVIFWLCCTIYGITGLFKALGGVL